MFSEALVYIIPLEDLTAPNTWLWAGLDIIKNTLKLPIADSSSVPKVKGLATVHRHNLKSSALSYLLFKESECKCKQKKMILKTGLCEINPFGDGRKKRSHKPWAIRIRQQKKTLVYFSSSSGSFIRNDLLCAHSSSRSHCSCSGCLCHRSVSCAADFGLKCESRTLCPL